MTHAGFRYRVRGLGLGVTLVALLVGSSGCGKTDSTVNAGVGGEPAADAASAGAPGASAAASPAGELADGGSAESSAPASSVALTPQDGWLDGDSNSLMLHGAIFATGDPTSLAQTTSDFSGSNACISGVAARVDLSCAIAPPALDCFQTFRGPEIRLNLDQDPGEEPAAFDATDIAGFSFDLEGDLGRVIRLVATASDGTEYCTGADHPVAVGHNAVLFSEMREQCYKSEPGHATAEQGRAALVSIAWHVVTNTQATTAFDLCVSNLRALLE